MLIWRHSLNSRPEFPRETAGYNNIFNIKSVLYIAIVPYIKGYRRHINCAHIYKTLRKKTQIEPI